MLQKALLFLTFLMLLLQVNAQQLIPGNLAEGAYKSYEEFIQNNPGITNSFYLDKEPRKSEVWAGTYSITPRYSETGKQVKKIWGFSDGIHAYVKLQGEFFKIEKDSAELFFYGYDLANDYCIPTTGLIDGAIVGVAYAASELARVKHTKVKYRIHQESGIIIPPDSDLEPKVKKKTSTVRKLIIYRETAKEIPAPFELMVNDSLQYSLEPNSYAKLVFNSSVDTISICYGDAYHICESIPLNTDKSDHYEKYISCSYSEKEGVLSLTQMRHSKGEFDSYRAEKAQKKKGELVPVVIGKEK